jgi:hypothetical protein
MTFEDYIGYLGIITLNIQYSATSNRTLEEVEKIVIDRVNRISYINDNIDVVAFVTDQHNGNKYIAYSKSMLEKYDVLKTQWVLDLDMESINKLLNQDNTPICVNKVITIDNTKRNKIEFVKLDSLKVKINKNIINTHIGYKNIRVKISNPKIKVELK